MLVIELTDDKFGKASAVEIGTANFIDPAISAKIVAGIINYLERHNISDVNSIIGGLIV